MAASMRGSCVESCEEGERNETSSVDAGHENGSLVRTSRSNDTDEAVSKQLLYPEKYSECYQEDKLLIVGKRKDCDLSNRPKTYVMAQSSVLSKIKDFLPKLSDANREMTCELSDTPEAAAKFNIEHVEQEAEPHVEMNLTMIPSEMVEDSESSEDESSLNSDASSSSQSECEDSRGDPGDIVDCRSTTRVLKLPRQRTKGTSKPSIEVLQDENSQQSDLSKT